MSHFRAVSLMILVTLLWSTAGVVTRHLDSAPSFEVTFWRSTFNALALAVALTLIRGPGLWRRLLHSPRVIWISGICWASMFTAFMLAITLTTVANVLITLAVGPLITALFARLFLHHKLPPATWVAIVVASVGIAWMFRQDGDATLSLLGTLVALAVPIAAAVNFTILQHVGLNRDRSIALGAEPVQDMLPAVLIGATLSALVTLPLSWPFQASTHDLGLLSLLGIFQLAIPCLLVVRLSRELPAPEISLLALLEVIFGVTWAWLWAGEQPSANTLSGGALVLGALVANEFARISYIRIGKRKINSDTRRKSLGSPSDH
ncbi:MAG: DMT family transporter [Proteobacteria bacterium]|nr:DMT family transporter [Pseudomonadota bacterium]